MTLKYKAEIAALNKPRAIEYALQLTDSYEELQNTFADRLERIETEIATSRNTNKLLNDEIKKLNQRIIACEHTNINSAQYLRRRQIELWNLPTSITEAQDLKNEAAKLLSHTGVVVTAGDIDVCHKLKANGRIIMELRDRDKRDRVIRARKTLKNKKSELAAATCPKMSVVESICPEYKRMDYVCRRLLKDNKIEKTWFFNRKLNIVSEGGDKKVITHLDDLYKLFSHQIIDDYLQN